MSGNVIHRLLRRFWYLPDAVEPVRVHGSGPPLGHEPFTVISWNVQFGAGRHRCFFYDGGPDARATPAEVRDTLDGIGACLARHQPDLVLLQEVDRRSARTGWVDQVPLLKERIGLPVHASTPYFKVPYVPVPPQQPMGGVDMHLVVFSRFAMQQGRRLQLAALNEPRYRRAFNLRRALLHLKLGPLDLFQTHLSAFSRGDGTLDRQVEAVLQAVGAHPGVLLAGDFNCLPPGVDPSELGEAAVLYAERRTPIAPLYEALDAVFEDPGTYVPYGSNRADRTIDHAFVRGVEVLEAEVLPEGAAWSDHLPLRMVLRVSPPP